MKKVIEICLSLLPEGAQPRNSEDAWLVQEPYMKGSPNLVFQKPVIRLLLLNNIYITNLQIITPLFLFIK